MCLLSFVVGLYFHLYNYAFPFFCEVMHHITYMSLKSGYIKYLKKMNVRLYLPL